MQVSSLAVSSGAKKASSWRPDMDWNMILFCSLCYLHKKREYCITLLAHPCPVVFLRGQYPCLVSTVSCFFLSLLPFHFHFPSPFLSSSLSHLSLCRSYRLFVASFPSSLQDMLSVYYHFSDQSLMFYTLLRGHVVSQPSWGAFGIKLISLKSVWLSESSAHASIVCSCFYPFIFSLFTSCSQCIFT